jgi:hypothetical protein
VTDPHIRILRLMAQQRQRELRSYDADDHNGDVASPDHRQHLQRAATRTRARVADAQARRRQLEAEAADQLIAPAGHWHSPVLATRR